MEQTKPGNGYDSPFGNGEGATQMGPSNGAHNFLEDPGSNAPTSGGRDFTKESIGQKSGSDDVDKASVPSGGEMPFGGAVEAVPMPFKNLK